MNKITLQHPNMLVLIVVKLTCNINKVLLVGWLIGVSWCWTVDEVISWRASVDCI